jgi:voltage-gated potassium channel
MRNNAIRQLRYKIALAMALIMLSISFGVMGYMLIESYSFLEALYMTVITVATIGYGEVKPLSDSGRIFTIILIISNLGIFAYAISIITSILIQGDFLETYKTNKMKNRIAKLSNHVIVCGYGRNGKEACEILRRNRIKFVLLEIKRESLSDLLTDDYMHVIEDDATNEQVLIEAGIKHAKGLITTLPNDSDNVYVALTARELNQTLTIVSRASADSSVTKLKRAGADNVIMPDKIGGAHMASLIVNPDIKEFIDIISGQANEVRLEEINIAEFTAGFEGKTLHEMNIRHKTGANVIGLKRPDGSYDVNPDLHYTLSPTDKLIVLGTIAQMEKLRSML